MKQTVEVNGEKIEVQAPDQGAKSNSKNEYLVSVSEGVHEVFVLPDGKLSDGNELDGIEIIIPSEREALVARHFSSSGNGSGIAKTAHLVIKASMPGLVKNILVKVGDEIAKSSQVLVLEAMKMENSIQAPSKGKVKAIKTEIGANVEKNQVLIEFE
jgi:biotin carboxyl carrier protein